MSEVSGYLLSVVGVVLFSIVLDLILSDGTTKKYIKSIMSLILIFVLVSPLPKIIKNDLDFSFINSSVKLNEEYQNVVFEQQKNQTEKDLEKFLFNEGFKNIKITIWADNLNGFKINTIFVDLTGLVLAEKNQHINKYEAIKILLIKQTGIKEEQVIFND
ncbi:MAG: stage III sporulation protein AF [Clostridia bacterium]|nr:stage III sporulation protein AF [Clostridia bacterium]